MTMSIWKLIGMSLVLCPLGVVGAIAQNQGLVIMDKSSAPVRNAEVTINCGGPPIDGFANAQGAFSFDRRGGAVCAVVVGHPDFDPYEGNVDFSKQEAGAFPIVLRRRLAGALEITVIDSENSAPLAGVDVDIDCAMSRWSRTTDAAGLAQLSALMVPGTCRLLAQHRDYESAPVTLTIPYEAGRAITTNIRMARKAHVKIVRVTVVESADEAKPINEAHVMLMGAWASSYGGTTGASGVADIRIDRAGRFEVEVTRDNYYPYKSVFTISPGAANDDLALTITLARRNTEVDGSPALVSVRGQRLDGTIVDLEDARVTPEGGSTFMTWKDGKTTAKVPGYTGDSVRVVAEHDGYESETQTLTVPRFANIFGAPSITFTLREKKPDITGVNVVIEVTDRKGGRPIAGASVSLSGNGKATTDSEGNARFTVSGDSIRDKQSLRAVVTMPGFTEKWSDVSVDLLKPRDEPRYYSISIEEASNDRDSIFFGTWRGTGNANGITLIFNSDHTGIFTDTRPGQRPGGKATWLLDPDRVDFVATALGYGVWYRDGKLFDEWGNTYVK